MIDQELLYFFNRFAAWAAVEYEWMLTATGRIRAIIDVEEEEMMCPVSAQFTLETGCVTLDDMANIAATAFDLSIPAREVIFCAADNMDHASKKVRTRLLTLCRL